MSANAHDFEVDGFYYAITSLENRTVAVTCDSARVEFGYMGPIGGYTYSGDIVIPRSVTWNGRTFTVNEIFGEAFYGSELTSLTVPETVDYMYLNSAKIAKLTIEDSEKPLHASSRYQGYPNTGDKYGMASGEIEELYLGRNTPSQMDGSGIKRVTFGKNVTEIPSRMFYRCDITGTLVLPEHISSIGDSAFGNNPNLQEVQAPGVEVIGQYAFQSCERLADVQLPNSKYISYKAFEDCTSLVSFEIARGVSRVGGQVFEGCTGLESVTLPNSIVAFGEDVYSNDQYYEIFAGCTALKSITVNATVPFELEESNFDAMTYVNATLHVPAGSEEAYRNAPVWKNFFNIDGAGATDDNVCSVFLTDPYSSAAGCIVIGEDTVGPLSSVSVQKGETVVLRFVPEVDEYGGYALTMLRVNGEDVLSRVTDNELSIVVDGNLSIEPYWEYVESAPTLLTIRQAENGSVKMEVSEWETYRFYVAPSEGWQIHTVTFNDEDITSRVGEDGLLMLSGIAENSVLSVAFEQKGISVAAVEHSNAKVYGLDGQIVIAGVDSGEPIAIYNEAGMQLRSFRASSNTETVTAEKGHIYIVKLNGRTVKLAL